jgi:hypothetical protein
LQIDDGADFINDDGTKLFNHLYQACNILRGPVSADEYKTYLYLPFDVFQATIGRLRL